MLLEAKIDHIGIVVHDIEEALEAYQVALGLPLQEIVDMPTQQVRVAFLPVGDSNIELVQPTTEDSGVARYLQNRGEGIHHLSLQVEDIEATLEQLRVHGIPLIDRQPRPGAHGRVAFVHPKGMHGVLLELVQYTESKAGEQGPKGPVG